MTITLLGKVRRNDTSLTKKKIKGAIIDKDEQAKDSEIEWTWSGYWAYGSVPDDILVKTRTKKRKMMGARPFVYKFWKVRDASTILVPSKSYSQRQIYAVDDYVHEKHTTLDRKKSIFITPPNQKVADKEFITENVSLMEGTNIMKKEKISFGEINKSTSMCRRNLNVIDQHRKMFDHEQIQEISAVDRTKSLKSSSKVTFATTSPGNTYTDAGSTTHIGKCPMGGCWKGYFENVSTQKNKHSSRVSETFYLFFNSTPSDNARVSFEHGQHQPTNKCCFTNSHLHVRGMGTNLFGTFEILGGYVVETGILTCERIYLIPKVQKKNQFFKSNEILKSTFSRECMRRSRRISLNNDNPTTPTSNRHTRKRQPSWRRSRYGIRNDVQYEFINQRGRSTANNNKKKSRISSDGSGARKITFTYPIDVGSTNLLPRDLSSTSVSASCIMNHIPVPRVSKSRRKGKLSRVNTIKTRSLTCFDKVPPGGNPLEARWRSAHFFYYEGLTDSSSTPDISNPWSTNVTPRTLWPKETLTYFVYEGEMNYGKNLRDGLGVCLYNNGVIYEGQWKNNKEHGRGILITGDRQRIIYEGEWDRSKMHGKGTYSYYMKPGETNTQHIDHWNNGIRIGIYCGDFKENSRHGTGKYILADGSVYDGEWRDNVPSGKGTFSWVDSSVYDGQWKNGKKHGQGILRTYNGFFYDGSWVNNELEGRGMAIYPSGQTYEGMFSKGKREGRGTIKFTNGAIYEGRFRDDCIEGQGTLKMSMNVAVPRLTDRKENEKKLTDKSGPDNILNDLGNDFMIPIEFQSDIGRIHEKAGFSPRGI